MVKNIQESTIIVLIISIGFNDYQQSVSVTQLLSKSNKID